MVCWWFNCKWGSPTTVVLVNFLVSSWEGEQAHCASLCQAMGDGEKSGLAIASLKATDYDKSVAIKLAMASTKQ